MANTTMNINTFNSGLNILSFNLQQLNQARYDVFYNPNPLNVTFQQVDSYGNIDTVQIPNWSMLYSMVSYLNSYDISAYIPGQYVSNEVISQIIITKNLTIPSSFSGSGAYAGIVPTNNATFAVSLNNSSEIGTIVFPSGSSNGTFSETVSGDIYISANSILSVIAPSTVDPSIANISITISTTTNSVS